MGTRGEGYDMVWCIVLKESLKIAKRNKKNTQRCLQAIKLDKYKKKLNK